MNLTPEQLKSNWDKLIGIVEDTFEGTRKDNLLKMYNYFEDRMMFAPASGVIYYHNAFPGGYVCHILNITKFALKLYDMYKDIGMHTSEYTKEDIIFCTLHHDLGKVGNLDQDYYVPNESEWHRINQGKMYNYNEKLHYMSVTDRTIWLLNYFDIKTSELEFIAFRLADGMYEEANKAYLKGYGEDKNLKTNLPILIHNADMLATRWEKEQYMFSKDSDINYGKILNSKLEEVVSEKDIVDAAEPSTVPDPVPSEIKPPTSKTKTITSKNSKDLFDELFGD